MNIRRFINTQTTPDYQMIPLSEEQRYEFKIAADWGTPALGRSWLRMHPEAFRVTHPPRIVNNLYLDTNDLQSFQENRWGIGERAKMRLRWYGKAEKDLVLNPILELKIKNNLIGDKMRQELFCTLDLNQPYREIMKTICLHAGPMWQTRLHTFSQSTVINRYWREYYESPDGAIRATLDYDLVSYNQRFSAYPNIQRPIPHHDALLIEVKAQPGYLDRLQEAMGFFPIQRGRHSKYVNGLSGGPF